MRRRLLTICGSRWPINNQADTSTLGDALFFDSFVLQLNHTMAEMHTTAQLQPQRKTSIEKRTSVRPASHSDGPGRPEAIVLKGVLEWDNDD